MLTKYKTKCSHIEHHTQVPAYMHAIQLPKPLHMQHQFICQPHTDVLTSYQHHTDTLCTLLLVLGHASYFCKRQTHCPPNRLMLTLDALVKDHRYAYAV